MTCITFLASSKPFILPQHIEDAQRDEMYDYNQIFAASDAMEYWTTIMSTLLTMPYIYDVRGIENDAFFHYLEQEMEIGDTLELFYMPNQNDDEYYIKRALEINEAITINVGSLTYENAYGVFWLSKKHWVEELRHRTLVTDRGVTTIVKY